MYTAACILKALFQLPAGKLVDKYGTKRVLLLSEIVGFVVLTGYLFSRGFQGFLISYGLYGLFTSLYNPAYLAYLSNAVPTEERARNIGDLNALKGIITFPAPAIGGLLYDKFGFQAPIQANLILLVVALLPLLAIEE
jgi:MFS family permease